MNCPVDGAELKMADRQGIEIDYCPRCRGVWLDRGELDKLIERTSTVPGRDDRDDRDDRTHRVDPVDSRGRGAYRDDDDDGSFARGGYPAGDRGDMPRPKGRRRSLLGDLFDFD